MSFGLAGKLLEMPPAAPLIRGQRLPRALGRLLVACSRWRVVGEFPDIQRFVAIAAPHSSNWDGIFGISAAYAMGMRATWMGKNSLFRFGLRRLMQGLGGIEIDRSNPRGAVGQMVEMFRSGEKLWLFLAPEGTRKPVRKWRTGFWHIAQEAHVPILLLHVDFSERCIAIGSLFHPTGDKERDLQFLYDYYRPFKGKGGKSGLPTDVLNSP